MGRNIVTKVETEDIYADIIESGSLRASFATLVNFFLNTGFEHTRYFVRVISDDFRAKLYLGGEKQQIWAGGSPYASKEFIELLGSPTINIQGKKVKAKINLELRSETGGGMWKYETIEHYRTPITREVNITVPEKK